MWQYALCFFNVKKARKEEEKVWFSLKAFVCAGFALVFKILIYFAYPAILYTMHICLGGKKVMVWYSWIYTSLAGMMTNLFTIIPYIGEKYGRVHRSLLSHLKYMTFKDLRNSRGDVSHIVVGYQVEPRMERLNTLLDLFVRNYVLTVLGLLFLWIPLVVSGKEDIALLRSILSICGSIHVLRHLASLFHLKEYGHFALDFVYLLGLLGLDIAFIFCVRSVDFCFFDFLVLRRLCEISLILILFFLLFIFSSFLFLVVSLEDFAYVKRAGILIDLQQIREENTYKLKMKFNGILFQAKVGWFYLDFREDCVWLRRCNEPPYRIPYSSIDEFEIVGDDLWDIGEKKIFIMKQSTQ